MAVRVAMGAPRMHLLRQLLLESSILSGAGTLAGLAIAFWFARILSSMRLGSTDLPLHFQVQVDQRVVIFALVVGLFAAFMSGAIPAWRCSRNDLNSLLKSSDPHNRPHKVRARQMLVGAQVTVATLLLVLSGRLIKELNVEATQSPGFRVNNVLTMSLDPSSAGYDLEKAHAFYTAFVERLSAMPGVKSAAIAQDKPFGVVNNGSTNFTIEGYELPPTQQGIEVRSAFVGDGYFSTLDIPIIRGRAFDRRDGVNAPRTVIVNETMAERYWPKRDPIGARVEIKGDEGGPAVVIGIARNAKYGGMNEEPLPFLYRSYNQSKENGAALFVHTEGSPETFTSSIRAELRNIAPNMPIFDVRTMQDHFRENGLLESRLGVRVFTPLGAMGLLLGVLGLYGVIAYSVGQRAYEIGIRIAVGASNGQILRMVLLQGLRLSGIASVLGIVLAAALAVSGSTPDLGWAVNPHDPSIYIGVLLLMLIVTGAACYVPARRASMVDPNVTLRS
jgi:macrolide transport system ATP-binding/permease protein